MKTRDLRGKTALVTGAGSGIGRANRMTAALRTRGYTPERVAENLLRAVGRSRLIAPITPEAWVLYYGKRFAPGLLRSVAGWIQSRQRRQLELD